MGVFRFVDRLTRNLTRVVTDVAPIAAAAAPILLPGFGGIVAGAIAQQFVAEPGVVGARPQIAVTDPCQRPSFSAPFQARNFQTGGSPSGRNMAFLNTFQPRSAVGRQVVSRCPPNGTCPCPSAPVVSDPRVGLTAEQQQALARFSSFQASRFGRRI